MLGERARLVKHLVARLEVLRQIVFLLHHGHWRVLDGSRGQDLPLNHARNVLLLVAQANLLGFTLTNVLKLVQQRSVVLLLERVDSEMSILDDDLLVELINLALLLLLQLLDHVVARDEHRLEVVRCRERGTLLLDLALEVGLAVLTRYILEALELLLGLESLLVVRDQQVFASGRVRLLRVLVPVLSLHDIVEALGGFPSCLVGFLLAHSDLVLIDNGERK